MDFDENYKNVEFVEDLAKRMKIDKDPKMTHLFSTTIINHLVNYIYHEDVDKLVKMVIEKYKNKVNYDLDVIVKFTDCNKVYNYKLSDFPYIEHYHKICDIIPDRNQKKISWHNNGTREMEFNDDKQKIYLSKIPMPLHLTHLELMQCNLFDLPMFPKHMIQINVSFNHITVIPNLPDKLEVLKCGYNNVEKLPELPKSLKELECSYNKRLKLSNQFHDGLINLRCERIDIIELPELPDSIENIVCGSNGLYYLPKLPKSLITLRCPNNNFVTLSKLPDSIKFINCSFNRITRFPKIPSSMDQVICSNNKLMSLLPLKNVKYIYAEHNPCFDEIKIKYDFKEKERCPLNSIWGNLFRKNTDNEIFEFVRKKYFKDEEEKYKLNQSNKIGEWFLDCKYNPKYKYCRDRLKKEYNNIYQN